MCKIKLNCVTKTYDGTTIKKREGRYKLENENSWITFDIPTTSGQFETPDIQIDGSYEVQIRVQDTANTWSGWSDSVNFTVGVDCAGDDTSKPIISGITIPSYPAGGGTKTVTLDVSDNDPNLTYSWSSDCGATFNSTTTKNPTVTKINTSTTSPINCTLTVNVCDSSGNCSIATKDFVVPKKNVPTDTSPNWLDNGVENCSTSESANVGTDGSYMFAQQIDTNPNSPSYNQTRWVRAYGRDGLCDTVDTTPSWASTTETNCSTSSTSNVGTNGDYCFRKKRDTNPNSPTYNQTKWERDTSCDGSCNTIDTTPNWVETGVTNCSTSSTSNTGTNGDYSFKQEKDNNPDSSTYNQTRWVRNSSGDGACDAANNPNWTDTGNTNCSTSATTNTGSDGEYCFKEQEDTNTSSATYGQTRWVRNMNCDDICNVTEPAPNVTVDWKNDVKVGETVTPSVVVDQSGVNYEWISSCATFSSDSVKEPIITFNEIGNCRVTLRVTNSDGETTTKYHDYNITGNFKTVKTYPLETGNECGTQTLLSASLSFYLEDVPNPLSVGKTLYKDENLTQVHSNYAFIVEEQFLGQSMIIGCDVQNPSGLETYTEYFETDSNGVIRRKYCNC